VKITVEEWAAKNYSQPPSSWVLGKWRRLGQIYPPPERVGRNWFVEEDARRLVGDESMPSLSSRLAA
jgi:predicted site-specific integrase-resolvase